MLTLSPRRQSHILRNVFVMLGRNVETSHRITKRVYKNYHCYQQFLPWSWMQLISPAMAKFVVVWRWKWGMKEKRREKNTLLFGAQLASAAILFMCLIVYFFSSLVAIANSWILLFTWLATWLGFFSHFCFALNINRCMQFNFHAFSRGKHRKWWKNVRVRVNTSRNNTVVAI